MNYPLTSLLALPYARLELPGWGKLLSLTGCFDDSCWRNRSRICIRGKWHGYRMNLDLSDIQDRYTYFLGRFSDLPTQLFIRRFVGPGDTFMDIGANVGMITLLAARLVGPNGKVVAVEPNPEVLKRLRGHVEQNGLRHVEVLPVALSDAEGILPLRVWDSATGFGTLGQLTASEQSRLTGEYRVRVARGDAVLKIPEGRPLTIKIDVEGYECHVLRGLREIIMRHRPAIITEVEPAHLARCGSTPELLFGLLAEHGYRPYALETMRKFMRHQLHLRPIKTPDEINCTNIAWVLPSKSLAQS